MVHAIDTRAADVTCYQCNKKGHYARECKSKTDTKWVPKDKPKVHWKPPTKDVKEIKKSKINTISIGIIQIKTQKTTPTAVLPNQATKGSAGYDLTLSEDGEI